MSATDRPIRRVGVWAVAGVLGLLALLGLAAPASAHPSPWSTLTVGGGSHQLVLHARVPIDRYELATGEQVDDLAEARAGLVARVDADVQVTVDGTDVPIVVRGLSRGTVNGYPALDFEVVARYPAADPASVSVTWRLVTRQIVSHKVYLLGSRDGDGRRSLIGVLTDAGPTAQLIGGGTAVEREVGIGTMIRAGMNHIATGYDHLLFLTMLLLPAPLAVRRRGRNGLPGLAATAKGVLLIATSFTLGHSTTLALVSFGLLKVPTRPIETLVAVSIIVAGIHAVRPLVRRGEMLIAAGFGLVHGGAFAETILELHLGTGDTIRAVFGFNVGIEIAQIVVIVFVAPLLFLASASLDYRYLVAVIVALGTLAAADWIVAIWTAGDPLLQGAFDLLAARPLLTWAGLAAISISMWATRRAAEVGASRQESIPGE
ncbi:MAG: HupE/UreJ family protein [Nocardioides sp.]|uniref:HupE/UreJ family protein n=1 Tax=Nocardioides sp. TaxID=35761 RepID=UPI0039E5F13B